MRSGKQFALNGSLCAFQGAVQIVVSYVVDLFQGVSAGQRFACDVAQNVQHARPQVFKLRAEQGHGQLVLLQRVFDAFQCVDHLRKRQLRSRAALRQGSGKGIGVQPQFAECLGGGFAAVHGADAEFLHRVADLVDGKRAGFCTVDQGLHELVGVQAQGCKLRRVFAQHVQHVAVLVCAPLSAEGD